MSVARRCVVGSILIACGISAACGERDSDSGTSAAVRDSVGIRIVEYGSDPEPASVAIELVWEYGHKPHEYSFQFVLLGALRTDCGAVVGDMGNQEVVAIDFTGSQHTVWAGSGQGPSEVRSPRAIRRSGDGSIWVEDVGNAKLMLFDGDSVVTTVSTQGSVTLTYGMMPQGVDAEGHLLMTTSSYRSDFDQPWLDGHMTRFDPVGGVLDTVGSYPMAPHRLDEDANPFMPSGVVSSTGGGFIHARTDIPALTWRAANCDLTQIVRWNPVPAYPTELSRNALRRRSVRI